MQRVTRSTAVAVAPLPPASPGTPGHFAKPDPVAGVPATVPGYEWYEGVQEALALAIEDSGVVLDASVHDQLRKHIRRLAGGNVTALTVNTVLTADHAGILAIAITAARTFTLPAANAAGGRPMRFTFVRTDATAFVATVQRAGADTIEGLTSLPLAVGERLTLVSDGVSAWRIAAGVAGRLLNVQVFAASGTYTPTPGTGSVEVEVQGGGGAGGGTTLPTVGNVSLGAPGGAGAYGRARFTAAQFGASQAVTVGAGGVATAATAGANGGTSSFGALLSAPGGVGGGMLNNQAPPTINGNGTSSAAAAGANIDSAKGSVGSVTLALSATAVQGGPGGFSRFGAGASGPGLNVNGTHAETAGSGGSGCAINNAGGGSYRGGNGAAGQVIVWEYT